MSRPLIGLSGGETLIEPEKNESPRVCGVRRDYLDLLNRTGSDAVVLPFSGSNSMDTIVTHLDGIVFTGGDDIDPAIYGEPMDPRVLSVCRERDDFELKLMAHAHRLRIPIFAICRGMQILNVFRKGTLYQHIDGHRLGKMETALQRRHPIAVQRGTLLHSIVGRDEISITSTHHQAVKALGDGLRISAVAADGVVEAIEDIDPDFFILGIEGHPEREPDEASVLMAKAFVAACAAR